MEPMELVGTEYLPKALMKRIRTRGAILYWDEVPTTYMATESDLRPHHGGTRGRGSYGRRDLRIPFSNREIREWGNKKRVIDELLSWNGCGRAVSAMPFDDPTEWPVGNSDGILFQRCYYVADSTGFCNQHRASAIKDGRVEEIG